MSATVAACQLDIEDLDVEANLAAVTRRVRGLSADVDVALFPEHTLTGFLADGRIADAALSRDGAYLDRLHDLAATEETALLVGFVEEAGESLYNAAAYVTPDGDRTVYRKRHLWGGERELLEPGDELVTVESPAGTTGILTCYDLNFVEDSAAFARERVDALFVLSAWPGSYSENWRLLMRARALDGVRWAIGASRTGRREVPDARVVDYAGRSLVVRPDGGVHATLDRREETLVAELDAETLAHQRELVGIFEREE